MRNAVIASLVLGLLAISVATPRAAVDVAAVTPKRVGLELIVIEAPGCIYCDAFRRDVLPVFTASERGKDIPVRFVDINDLAEANLSLTAPIEMAPTIVIAKANAELGRIAGFVGRDTLFQSIGVVLSTQH
ncbi:MAG: thioredoxin fold domain-containing protein [Hyphomicrobium sp.]